ncbi:phage tail sheath family protein [Streptomyces sp. NBC_01233]|uniref:phage tail sheath family protein n=1 Tax=Streptomyces sp. NBC_01233 TaxID=2903787 RepID=UPI002E0E94BD|nr:phage tail sheath subtilisin-like domain-containing protein [Streptomyces sp. NBC_01233]
MPVNVSFPGVYIHEVKSRVRTITGVPTSVAAFVGLAPRGPSGRPVHITGWADYEAQFGGLDANGEMGHAVYQFFLNGGTDAEIVRLVAENTERARVRVGAKAPSDDDNRPILKAASGGIWAKNLRVRVDHDNIPTQDKSLYNLTVRDMGTGVQESYTNISSDPDSPYNLTKVLSESRLVRVDQAGTGERPLEHGTPKDSSDDLLAGPREVVPAKPDDDEGKPEEPHGEAEGEEGEEEEEEGAGNGRGNRGRGNRNERGGEPKTFIVYEEPGPMRATSDDDPALKDYRGNAAEQTGIHALLKTDIFNLLCLPGAPEKVLPDALQLCVERRAILLVDPPKEWNGLTASAVKDLALNDPVLPGDPAKNAALYFPEVLAPDPLQDGKIRAFPPCGVMAGVLARTDAQRGVWKAAAGTDASLAGVTGLTTVLTDRENGLLNPLGVNCLRQLPLVGPVAWGARTLRGADRLADEWKYLPVRRLALFVEESLFRGTQWVVFEPNDEPLWSSIRLNVGAFMNSLFREGAFQGRTPDEAYLVKCDRENNPQNDIDRGIVNIQVGFAPLKPAEFVIIHIEQLAGQIQT